MSAYAVIEESGEYSSFSYEPVAVFRKEEDAYAYAELLTTRLSKKKKIAALRCEWVQDCEYVVRNILDGDTITPGEEDNQLVKELHDAQEWRAQKDIKDAEERIVKNTELDAENEKRVFAFLDWWDTGMHLNRAFDSEGRKRADGPLVQKYALRTLDKRAMDWCSENKDSIIVPSRYRL